nr:DUF4249 family protein [Pedobacter panaciterrae]
MEIKLPTILAVVLAVFFLFSCKKDSSLDNDYTRPVVEGYLVPGKSVLVKVYYQKYLDDTISLGFPVTDLKLKISDGAKTVELTEGADGNYAYGDTTFVAENKTYSLSFSYNNKIISSQTTVPNKPAGFVTSDSLQKVPVMDFGTTPATFVPITLSWNNTNGGHYMMILKNTENSRTSINPRNNGSYRDSEVILGQVSSFQTQQMTFNYLGNYRVLLFHINKEYSDALNNNGGSSLNLTNPYTNIVNGLGIFTSMQTDSLNLRVYQ